MEANDANDQQQRTTTTATTKKDFICGVVEGFYGRPWTKIQREELFKKLKKWGMGAYVYAPKDDYKHRAYWRELYTVEEADHLSSLIAAAKEQGVRFYYALSPGLDMSYSSQKEIQTLKRKLDQVSQFGCDAFALLFDDIDSELSKADKEVFQTFANAQVSVTNEICAHLGNPKFLFCPTQYCSTRAVPNVRESEYLNTLGSKLNNDIDILWTGNKVISKIITLESIEEITEVLRRPPVIWDNLHANDYDQKRVFLGPYGGRSPALIPYLRGVLTNPNCEFHANTIAIHTLAFWSHCNLESKVNSTLSADIKLETENEDGTSTEELLPVECCNSNNNIYHPKIALKNAVMEWLPEFFVKKEAWGPITKPQPQVTMVMPIIPIIPSINTCMSLTTTTTTSTTTKTVTVPEVNTTQLQALADVCSTVTSAALNQPISNPVMNSLVSPTKVVMNDEIPNPIPNSIASNIELPKKIPISIVPVPINVENIMDNGKNLDAIIQHSTTVITMEEQEMKNEILEHEADVENIKDHIKLDESSVRDSEANIVEDEDIRIDEKLQQEIIENNALLIPIDTDDNDNLSPTEPMECSSLTSQMSPREQRKTEDDIMMTESNSVHESCMQVESAEQSPLSNAEMKDDVDLLLQSTTRDDSDVTIMNNDDSAANTISSVVAVQDEFQINAEDLYLLCDLFYLPFEHGNRACKFLNEFNWLKSNAHVLLSGHHGGHKKTNGTNVTGATTAVKPEISEWFARAERFDELCNTVQVLMKKVANCANQEICYDLFTYVWDIAGALMILNAFVKWLSLGHFPHNIYTFTQGTYTWFSKGWKEAFMSGDQEPWVFRGGVIADLQRLLPVDSGNDLFLYKLPEKPLNDCYLMRPYRFADESAVYNVCLQHFMQFTIPENNMNELPAQIMSLIPDSIIGPFITLSPEFCIVAHESSPSSSENNTIVAYIAAALDIKVFVRNSVISWFPELREKYDQTTLSESLVEFKSNTSSRMCGDIMHAFIEASQDEEYQCPIEVSSTYPAVLQLAILKETYAKDEGLTKRLLTVLLAALRSNGCFGVHTRLINNKNVTEEILHYNRVGFCEVYRIDKFVYLGRRF